MDNIKKELTIERVFNAPIDLVWKVWTDPKLVQQWWGPRGVTNPVCEFDAKVGGKMNITMLAGEEMGPMAGQRWPMTGEFTEVVENEKLVFTNSPMLDGKAFMDTITSVTFEKEGEKTKMIIHISVTRTTPEAEGPLSGMEMGWNQQIDKLEEFLSKEVANG